MNTRHLLAVEAEDKADATADVKTDAKADVKTDATADLKTDAKADDKAEAKVEDKDEAKAEDKDEAKTEDKDEAKAEDKADDKAEVTAGTQRFGDIVKNLPATIPMSQANQLTQTIDPRRVTPLVDRRMGYGVGARYGFGRLGPSMYGIAPYNTFGRFGGIGGFGGFGGAYADGGMISGYVAPAFAARMGRLRYLPFGNLRFPYEQIGDNLQPYVVDRRAIPFFVEKTTVAIPRVTQVPREVAVARSVTVDQPITVQQAVPVQRTVNVPQIVNTQSVVNVPTVVNTPTRVDVPVSVTEQAIVPVQTTIPVQTTVMGTTTVMEPHVDTTLAESTSVVGPGGNIVPMTYTGGIE